MIGTFTESSPRFRDTTHQCIGWHKDEVELAGLIRRRDELTV